MHIKLLFSFVLLLLLSADGTHVEWVTTTEHDFGILKRKNPETFEFVFRNTSTKPITIDNVRTSCGCAAPDWSYEPVAPDSTAGIRIRYDAQKEGYFRKKIKVYFSGQRRAEVLVVEGEVE